MSPTGSMLGYSVGSKLVLVDTVSGELITEITTAGDVVGFDLREDYALIILAEGPGLLVSVDGLRGEFEVPVDGLARFVTAPVDIAARVVPPTPAAIQLRSDGLGVVDFGDAVEEVMAVLTSLLGPPDWEEVQISAQVDRGVAWGSSERSLWLHFVFWDYFDTAPPTPMPEGPVFIYYATQSNLFATEAGITTDSTVSDLKTAYPDLRIDETCGPPDPQDQWRQFVVDPPAGWLHLPMFFQLDGDIDDPDTRIVSISAGYDVPSC